MDWLWKWVASRARDYFLRNWATTVPAIVGGVLSQVPGISANTSSLIMALTVAIVGTLAKSASVTGTTEAPRLPPVVEGVLAKSAAAMVAAPPAVPVVDPADARIAAQSHTGP